MSNVIVVAIKLENLCGQTGKCLNAILYLQYPCIRGNSLNKIAKIFIYSYFETKLNYLTEKYSAIYRNKISLQNKSSFRYQNSVLIMIPHSESVREKQRQTSKTVHNHEWFDK